MGANCSASTKAAATATAQSVNARISSIEEFLRKNNMNINLTQAYQQVTLLYNQFKNALDITREDLDKQISDFEQLKAYVNSLALKNIPPEIWAEFDRVAKFIKDLYDNDKSLVAWQTDHEPACAFGQCFTFIEQKAGSMYPFVQQYTTNYKDIEFQNGSALIKRRGIYRVLLNAFVASDNNGNGKSELGIYINGSVAVTVGSTCYWGMTATPCMYMMPVTNVPTTVSAGCTKDWWGEYRQMENFASLTIERMGPIP